MKRTTLLFCSLLFLIQAFGQGMVSDGFVQILGKKVDAQEVQQFFTSYEIKYISGAKYSSATNGIDINTHHDTVIAVNVYKSSTIYGNYTGKLSKGLTFGMKPAQVEQKLGKATTAYMNSGYAEHAYPGYVITCWYEQGVLSQLSYSPQ